MGSEVRPGELEGIASDLIAAAGRLDGVQGACPAALPGAGAEVSAVIAELLSAERAARTRIAEGAVGLAEDLARRAEIARLSDRWS